MSISWGGIVYDLEKLLPQWARKGWIDRERFPKHGLTAAFQEEFNAQYAAKTGLPSSGDIDLQDLSLAVAAARQRLHPTHCWLYRLLFQRK